MTGQTKAAMAIGIGWIIVMAILATPYIADAIIKDNGPFGEFPKNPGYLRSNDSGFGKLTIFDADAFKVYRMIDLPPATLGRTHRLERDGKGRIWIGYVEDYTGMIFPRRVKSEVRVFSAKGDLEHVLDTQCGPPDGGIAFANGYAFIGCPSSEIAVADIESMDIVKTLEIRRPHPWMGINDFSMQSVEEVDGSILALGVGYPPEDYDEVRPQTSGAAVVARIDPETLTVDEYKAEFPPGATIMDAVEVDGAAWLLNSFSHIVERPPRVDVYVINPHTLAVLDSFNLDKPYPTWGERGADGDVYIYHSNGIPSDFDVGHLGGVTRINPDTRESEYAQINSATGRNAPGYIADDFAMRGGTPFVVTGSGLWRVNGDDRPREIMLEQDYSIGVLFAPPSADLASAETR